MLEKVDRIEKQLDLENDRLIQSILFCRDSQPLYLILTAHHVIMDGVSWRILLEDINHAAKQSRKGEEARFLHKTTSYLRWAESLHYLKSSFYDQEQSYWNEIICKVMPFFSPSAEGFNDSSDDVENESTVETHYIEIPEDITSSLLGTSNQAYNTRTIELILAGLFAAIREVTGKSAVSLDLEGNGREALPQGGDKKINTIDLSRSIGWFTSLYPFVLSEIPASWGDLIIKVKEQLRRIPRGGVGYGVLKYIHRSMPDAPNNDFIFNYLGEFTERNNQADFSLVNSIHALTASQSSGRHKVEINGGIFDHRLRFEARIVHVSLAEKKQVKLIMDRFYASLLDITQHCSVQHTKEFTPSDFESVDLTQDELDSIFS
jgi:non-ribosomal peptide synthase protein (TIGR01720 family)